MFFSLLPDIQYKNTNSKEYITVKNIFSSYQINQDLARNENIFTKYIMKPNTTIQDIAREYYGDPFYDWIIILINNIINPTFAIPLNYDQIILKIKKEGNGPFDLAYHIDENGIKYYGNSKNITLKETEYIPVTYLEHENKINDENSTLYLPKKRYFRSFIDDFKKEMDKFS